MLSLWCLGGGVDTTIIWAMGHDVVHRAGSFGVLEDVGAILSLSLPLLSLRDPPLAPG